MSRPSDAPTTGPAPGVLAHQEGAPPWAPVRPTNTKAILAVSLLWVAPAAIVFGALARKEIRRTGEGGWGLATWGLSLGIASVALYVLYFAAILFLYLAFIVGLVASSGAGAFEPTGLEGWSGSPDPW